MSVGNPVVPPRVVGKAPGGRHSLPPWASPTRAAPGFGHLVATVPRSSWLTVCALDAVGTRLSTHRGGRNRREQKGGGLNRLWARHRELARVTSGICGSTGRMPEWQAPGPGPDEPAP